MENHKIKIYMKDITAFDVACALASLAEFDGHAIPYKSTFKGPGTINIYHDEHITEHPGFSQPQILVVESGFDEYDIEFNPDLVDPDLIDKIESRIQEEYRRTGTDG